MSTNPISSSTDNSLWQLLENSQSGSTSASSALLSPARTSSTSSTTGSNGSVDDSSSLSPNGQLFSELEGLSQSDPAKFKEVTAELSQKLQNAAANASDPHEAKFLNDMASHLEKASQSGNFSDLFSHSAASDGSSSNS